MIGIGITYHKHGSLGEGLVGSMVIECVLCGKVQGIKDNGKLTKFDKHHIDYDKDITMLLCWACHMHVHARLRFRNPWEHEYGKNKGFYELAKAFIGVYERLLPHKV